MRSGGVIEAFPDSLIRRARPGGVNRHAPITPEQSIKKICLKKDRLGRGVGTVDKPAGIFALGGRGTVGGCCLRLRLLGALPPQPNVKGPLSHIHTTTTNMFP
jgi:hypothetical protein